MDVGVLGSSYTGILQNVFRIFSPLPLLSRLLCTYVSLQFFWFDFSPTAYLLPFLSHDLACAVLLSSND